MRTGLCLGGLMAVAAASPAREMADAARAFLTQLDAGQKVLAHYSMADPTREHFHHSHSR